MSTPSDQMIANSDAMALFPTFVWKYQLKPEAFVPMNERLIGVLDELRPVKESVPKGKLWQTAPDLHLNEGFAELIGYVSAAAGGVFEFLKVLHRGFEVTGCWANIAGPGASHPRHTHPNNYLSGVYYVQADANANRISFLDPRVQRHVIDPRVSTLDMANAGEATIDIQPGTLVTFPAWLEHSVPINASTRERISVSFNVMFKDYSAAISPPRWTSYPWPSAD